MGLIVTVLLLASCSFSADLGVAPQVESVTPKTVKPGDTVVISGISLGNDQIEDVFLTDHKFDMKCKILEQNSKVIRFRIPPFAKPGRMQLLLLTKEQKDEDALLLEIPAYFVIEEPSTEIGQVQPPDAKGKKQTQK